MLEAGAEILSVLSRNKLRTVLTALSVAWGMFMLAVLLGAGRGLENGVAWEFRDGATAALWVRSGQTSLPYAGRPRGRYIHLSNEDYAALGREIPGIGHRSGRYYMWGEFQVSYRQKAAAFDVRGTHPGHLYLEKTEITRGRFLNDADVKQRRKVAVIGEKVRKTLFGDQNPIGEHIVIRGLNYLVVGEFQDVGGEAELNKIYVPISIAQLAYGQPDIIHNLMFTLTSEDLEKSRETARLTREMLGKRHAVAPEDNRAIRVQNNLEEFRRITQVFTWINVFVWIVALGTLLAGIVGVSNIMLIAVAERTREIGIRKALGATKLNILAQFLIEAVVLCVLGGVIGIALGAGGARVMSLMGTFDTQVSSSAIIMAFAFSAFVGVAFGVWPARRAAKMDPIIALRYE